MRSVTTTLHPSAAAPMSNYKPSRPLGPPPLTHSCVTSGSTCTPQQPPHPGHQHCCRSSPPKITGPFSPLLSSVQAVKQNPGGGGGGGGSDKAIPSRSGPVKKESIGAQYRHHPLRARRRPPKGMHLEQADITALSASQDSGVVTIRQLDIQLVSLKRQVLIPAVQVRLNRSCPVASLRVNKLILSLLHLFRFNPSNRTAAF